MFSEASVCSQGGGAGRCGQGVCGHGEGGGMCGQEGTRVAGRCWLRGVAR